MTEVVLRKYLLFSVLTFVARISFAQFGNLFTADKELSSSIIHNVFQDRNNIIWIATDNGLNRYDGSKFTVYNRDKNNPKSILNNMTRVIFEDSRRRLFVGYFNGLQVYDHAADSFHEVPLLLDNGDKFPSHVLAILERKNGEVLIGTSGQGLLKLHVEDGNLVGRRFTDLIQSNLIKCLYEDRNQNLWVATEDFGLLRLDQKNNVSVFFNEKPCSITSICEDAEGRIYAGSITKGLFMLDEQTDSFVSIPYSGHPSLPIKTLFLTQHHQIYIGTDGNGLKIYDPRQKRFIQGNFNVATFDFSKAKIHSIIEDNQGNIWLGIFQKGVLLLPSSTSAFDYIGYKSTSKNWIGSSCIMSVCQDHEKTLWVGADNDGLYGIQLNGEKIIHYSYSSDPASVPPTILSIFEDSDHNLWLGSYLHGMARLNRRTGKCQYLHDILNVSPNEVQRIFSMVEDHDKNLWIGAMGLGLYCLNLKTFELTRYDGSENRFIDGAPDRLHNPWINTLYVSSDNKLYIGTVDGLGCLDLETRSFISAFGVNQIFPRLSITALAEDNEDAIWVGSSEGLWRIDKTTHEIRTFTTEQGLVGNAVQAIRKDNEGNLWISSNSGISRLRPEDATFTNYYASDGLQGNEFSMNAATIDDKGRLIFGGIHGLTLFRPSEINDQKKSLEVRITDFYIHDQPVRKGIKSGGHKIIDTAVFHAKKFHLSHRDNSFSIEFSTMNFTNPERITYIYSLNNDDWIALQPGTNRVTFNNLAPSHYIFRVKAKDFNVLSEEKTASIIISPPWYLTFWAKMIYFLVLFVSGYATINEIRRRKQLRQKMMEHEHAEQINQTKLQLFTNISHEIRTPMSLIVSPLKKLMATDNDLTRQKAYQIMSRNVDRILHLVNQLMDVRKIELGQMSLKFRKTQLATFIPAMTAMFEEKAQSKNIELIFENEAEDFDVWIDPKAFDKVILNILSNAFKFTPDNGKIRIKLSTGEDENAAVHLRRYVQIVISDTGIGIEPSEIERIFERFYQGQNGQNLSSVGTGIGLHLSRSIVELHYGEIHAENNKEGEGCSFVIRLPLGKDHLKPEEIENDETHESAAMQNESLIYPTPMEADEDTKARSRTRIRVLVVDDDEEVRSYICQELSKEYQMMESVNGKEALSIILTETPDLVISDIMMPEMDGIELCRKIKQNVNVNHIPVILLTAKSEEQDELEGLDTGADAYMMKPFSIDVLSKTIHSLHKNREILRSNYSRVQLQNDKIQKVAVKSADDRLLAKVMDMINQNIHNPALSVELIAREVGISRVHLHRKLKELTGLSTRDFIRNIRLQQAAELFSSKRISVAEVAYAVGFSNLTHFSNAFKELFGLSPTLYAEKHLKEEIDEKISK